MASVTTEEVSDMQLPSPNVGLNIGRSQARQAPKFLSRLFFLSGERTPAEAATNGKAGTKETSGGCNQWQGRKGKRRKPFLFHAAEAVVMCSKIVSHGLENRLLLLKE
jgi:hypothetical protein